MRKETVGEYSGEKTPTNPKVAYDFLTCFQHPTAAVDIRSVANLRHT